MNALIANCSDGYNLAVHRLGAWLQEQGATVEIFEGVRPGDLDLAWADRVYLSVIFSWDLPAAAALARRAQELQTAVEAAVRDLHRAGVRWQDIQVYLLYNHRETPEEAVERARQVVGNRESPLACPWPMAYAPLNWMDPAEEYVSPGWTLQEVRDFRRYWSRPQLWRTCTWVEYDRGYIRSGEAKGYPVNWNEIATRIKDLARWCCEHCGHRHDPENGYALTVHHLDGSPSNNVPENLVALCQRCHRPAGVDGGAGAGFGANRWPPGRRPRPQ